MSRIPQDGAQLIPFVQLSARLNEKFIPIRENIIQERILKS